MRTDWDSVVAEHGQMVLQAAMRILGNIADAEEVAQEVFLEAACLTNPGKIRNWGAYLRRGAVFRALDRRRHHRKLVALPEHRLLSAELSPPDEAIRRELAEQLRSLIASLPEREGAVFALRYLERLSNPQIAEVLQISSGAVAAALHKVRSKLETTLFHEENYDAQDHVQRATAARRTPSPLSNRRGDNPG